MHHLTAGNQEKSARSTRFISLSKDLSAKLSAFALASKQMGENECKLGLISFEHDEIPNFHTRLYSSLFPDRAAITPSSSCQTHLLKGSNV